ncbi:MAG: hypothetical protein COU29_03440 [Candidatus Magasanikbacteria bacterium CG10_big_fil_rev_8_21_14_0_10_36_32]|uniref:Peptidase M50 domain-containing protein n=1 Tax=Candidatus Magasanikbacteria bacterium CG10_big_fil_rev_8_21_14_0_10_36_32 TaxID=1974646 RepID=A0A2M6W5M5_9BACT|nr:MAG: hypothetical protein COU29_03440 [Candidatus Magasanikbacteria bacterium CG10_big_fil_rev_8_21_14_0_10_36_32]
MKHCGFEVKGVYFIIIGCAAVGGNDKKGGFGDRRDEAFIAIMGPLWGVVSTLIPTAIYLISGNVIWGAIALFNIVLNVFNLLPFASLDGGRIIRAIAFSINNWLGMAVLVLGLGALCWLVVTVNQPLWWALGIFMVFLSINELRYEYLSRHETGRIRMRAGKMIGYFSAYLGLIAFYIFVFIMLISNEAVVLAMESLVQ